MAAGLGVAIMGMILLGSAITYLYG
jgi:hypothetical protein